MTAVAAPPLQTLVQWEYPIGVWALFPLFETTHDTSL